VDDGSSSAVDLPVTIGVEQRKAIDAVGTAEHLPDDVMYVPSRV
jgi:hypothetical protein